MLGEGEAVHLDNIKIDKKMVSIISDPMKGGCEFAALWADINGPAV
jgi:hypothetical protein